MEGYSTALYMFVSFSCILLSLSSVGCESPNNAGVEKSSFEDKRCKCVCPNVAPNGTIMGKSRTWIKDDLDPTSCDCYHVLEDHASGEVCALCECLYESRNTTVIKVVVIFIICVVALLFIYMCFLLCLDPLIAKRPRTQYQQQVNEEVNLDNLAAEPQRPTTARRRVDRQRSVINQVTDVQKRWKDTVQEQRKQIYDHHSLLN
ncbi:proton-transporting V-type ATPase complex assembly regulator TMEM9-like isoform X1 [Saccostrea echinata]|uniref:proton-transporting V-type ATPase complex assembly regulator TMEM9-like isoform X1 n=1 Tax=Saccostrea echinata TaxID=191078 RepID=UPI002A803E30|nr:proton-transporting V-type ATPase complex assembly regulator TMEM9-like isoform X1 [Saccostrea echinata]XP_061177049.1 proton-transporting V-type ATPase complex assembly regulator TMEM9-like isoform X1 [Saccostrea echinata]